MKLLILSQKVDKSDDLLGFFQSWLKVFAQKCEKLTVICLQKGVFELPASVNVLSLGKENGRSRLKYIYNFFRYIWRERKNYDAVFVHMNAEYVVLGGLFWKLLGKRIGLWFVHRKKNWKLKLAEILADVIFTASEESFRLSSKKVLILGHGIDTEKFRAPRFGQEFGGQESFKFQDGRKLRIVYVGRISPIKNQELLVRAVDLLVNKENFKNIEVTFVGAPVMPGDEKYLLKIKELIGRFGLGEYIKFTGSVPNKDIGRHYQEADLSVNLCPTGGVDKAVLESMASGLPVLALNKAFEQIFGSHGQELVLKNSRPEELAEKIKVLLAKGDSYLLNLGDNLRQIAVNDFNIEMLISKILAGLSR